MLRDALFFLVAENVTSMWKTKIYLVFHFPRINPLKFEGVKIVLLFFCVLRFFSLPLSLC